MCLYREELFFICRIAEQAERFDNMYDYIKKVGILGVEFSKEERSLLVVACKNIMGPRRGAWRTLSLIEQEEASKSGQRLGILADYKAKELTNFYNDVLELLDSHLLKNAISADSRVFFIKMKADFHRYMLKITKTEIHQEASSQAYQEAFSIAKSELKPTNPIRLGLAINYSVFLYEAMNAPRKACKLSKEAFDVAIAGLDCIDGDEYEETITIMQIFRDSLTLWSSEQLEDEEVDLPNSLSEAKI